MFNLRLIALGSNNHSGVGRNYLKKAEEKNWRTSHVQYVQNVRRYVYL